MYIDNGLQPESRNFFVDVGFSINKHRTQVPARHLSTTSGLQRWARVDKVHDYVVQSCIRDVC